MKRIIQICISMIWLFFISSPLFAQQQVEDIFIDIDKNFEYKYELQYLFNQWFIQENNFKNFSPNSSISREEFLWLLIETNCQKCVKPNTNIDILSTYYKKNVYYDVNKNSDYFYCIAYADDKSYIQWYQENTQCDNGEVSSQAPFCPYNPIKFEEALAIIMRTSGLMTQEDADKIIQKIYKGENFPNIWNDIKPKLENWDVYSFYPYFYAAKNISYTQVDVYGNIQEFFLLDTGAQNYFPKSSLTKKQMLRLAYFSHKNSQCSEPSYQIWWEIQIKNGSCKADESCNLPPKYSINTPIDFEGIFDSIEIIQMPDENYTWVIHNLENNSEKLYNGKYLDNIIFDKSWDYKADLFTIDALWNTGKFTQNFTINSNNKNDFEWYISHSKSGDNNSIQFNGKINGESWPFEYYWDFGDGNTSNEKNPNHSYAQPGNYDVKLIVTDSQWEKKYFYTQSQIYTSDNHSGWFPWVDIVIIWENNVADFNAHNIQADNYYWDFGDGNSSNEKNPNHSYAQPGNYDTTLVIETPLGSQTFDLQVTIPENENDFFTSINIQKNTTQDNSYNFSPKVTGWEWPFEYLWDFGDGNTSNEKNPSHNYDSTGNKTVTLTLRDSQGLQLETYTTIVINPEANYIKTLVQDTADINTKEFSAIQTNKNQNISYQWDFWDGNTSTKQNPNHTYTQPGKYEVVLKITDENEIKEVTMVVIIEEKKSWLVANAKIISKNTLTNNYEFEADILSGEWPFEYLWDFGDGNTSSQKNPNHTFTWPWPYQITLLVTDRQGNQVVKNFMIYPDYTNINIWLNISAKQNNTYWFEAKIISWKWPFEYLWDFGDGNTSSQKNPNHTFEYNGEYWVELTVIDKFGNQKKQFTTIIISSQENNDFNINISAKPSSWNAPLVSDFSTIIIWNQNEEYQYSWDFGDGNTKNGKNVTHTFYNNWSYIVTLVVTNSANITVEKTMIITVLDQKEIDEIGDNNIPVNDSDNDGINDQDDRCIDLPWDPKNQWCPIFDISCESDSDCPNSSKCASNILWDKTCIAIEKQVVCNDSNQGTIQGNVVCTTCPCQNTLNFTAQLRSCDVIFPAIVSPDGKDIYSKGKYFQIK